MYPVFGIRGASWVLACRSGRVSLLLFLGFWRQAIGECLGAARILCGIHRTVTIIPFNAGRLGRIGRRFSPPLVPFLMKDVVLVAASLYLLKQDVARVAASAPQTRSRPGACRAEVTR
jgi:hypothetical protein